MYQKELVLGKQKRSQSWERGTPQQRQHHHCPVPEQGWAGDSGMVRAQAREGEGETADLQAQPALSFVRRKEKFGKFTPFTSCPEKESNRSIKTTKWGMLLHWFLCPYLFVAFALHPDHPDSVCFKLPLLFFQSTRVQCECTESWEWLIPLGGDYSPHHEKNQHIQDVITKITLSLPTILPRFWNHCHYFKKHIKTNNNKPCISFPSKVSSAYLGRNLNFYGCLLAFKVCS